MNTDQASFFAVLGELEDGLVAVNDGPALQRARLARINREGPEGTEAALTRDGIRGLLERMTLFLKRPSPSYCWSRNQVLFFGELLPSP